MPFNTTSYFAGVGTVLATVVAYDDVTAGDGAHDETATVDGHTLRIGVARA